MAYWRDGKGHPVIAHHSSSPTLRFLIGQIARHLEIHFAMDPEWNNGRHAQIKNGPRTYGQSAAKENQTADDAPVAGQSARFFKAACPRAG